MPPTPHADVFIAIHGMGDQTRKESVRDVARLLATSLPFDPENKDRPLAPQPLGYFSTKLEDYREHEGDGTACPADWDEFNKGNFATSLFAEIYWADLPRYAVKDTHTLQEVKQWAQTVVARAKRLYLRAKPKIRESVSGKQLPDQQDLMDAGVPPDFNLAGEVLNEIIETVQVIENLTFLLDKAGIFTFELKQILEDYLGDVQQVADYENVRLDIVGRFHKKMQGIHKKLTSAGITDIRYHFIAHSEGTVVSFISMLYALKNTAIRPYDNKAPFTEQLPSEDKSAESSSVWVKCVRSYMTFGSPIDKHLLLWRHLWRDFVNVQWPNDANGKARPWPNAIRDKPIRWRNYYDYGDPVGFKLDTARKFLEDIECPAFEFEACHDHGFSRYLMAGKAHIDYWDDQDVFDHFIKDAVVNPVPALPRDKSSMPAHEPAPDETSRIAAHRAATPVPGSRWGIPFWSTAIPYGICAILMFIACDVLYSNASACMHPATDTLHSWVRFQGLGSEPQHSSGGLNFLRNVLGLTSLLVGVTLCVRFPRLLREKRCNGIGVISLVIGCLLYLAFVTRKSAVEIGSGFTYWLSEEWKVQEGSFWQPASRCGHEGFFTLETTSVFIVAILTCIIARQLRRNKADCNPNSFWKFLHQGMTPLIITGTFFVILTVAAQMATKCTWLNQRFDKLQPLDAVVVTEIGKLAAIKSADCPAKALEDRDKDLANLAKKLTESFQFALLRRDITPELLTSMLMDTEGKPLTDAPKKLEALGHCINLAHGSAPIWPVLLSLAVFFYLWWLAALLFDLTFVWHYYIRNSHSNSSLHRWRDLVRWQSVAESPTPAAK